MISFLQLNLPAKTRPAEMLRPWQFGDRSCARLQVPTEQLLDVASCCCNEWR